MINNDGQGPDGSKVISLKLFKIMTIYYYIIPFILFVITCVITCLHVNKYKII